ncbi:intradiol ring-cleavage dioxygenase [Spartinivicinus ruber]|uniref:intradiol ring-cleavage dioxygenase n=1 Tax=Spartinivicinus ruber TaxID=2683272 RepID=UPI0013D70AB4|nr:intradiol ring-cleavage dioxygenase [Spartinivicinus ruber]
MNRREMIKGVGVGSFSLIASSAIGQSLYKDYNTPSKLLTPHCSLTPEQIEGPFYIDTGLIRHDITENKVGAPLILMFSVVDAETCQPIKDAVVDLWQADALGYYSGFDKQGPNQDKDFSGETFLRGTQITNNHGQCIFQTIYPGHYTGRATHLHLKIIFNNKSLITTQLYFPDDISDQVHQTSPYNENLAERTRNEDDWIMVDGLMLTINPHQQFYGFEANYVLGVNKT